MKAMETATCIIPGAVTTDSTRDLPTETTLIDYSILRYSSTFVLARYWMILNAILCISLYNIVF